MSSGGWGGCVCQLIIYFTRLNGYVIWGRRGCRHLAQDYVFSFFSFSPLILFSYLASKNILFHPVQTNLDNSIKFLDSNHITHANFVKKCDQFCPIALLTEKQKTTVTVLWEIVYRSGLEKYKKFFSTYKKILWHNISIVRENFTFIHSSMIRFSSIIEFFLFFREPEKFLFSS